MSKMVLLHGTDKREAIRQVVCGSETLTAHVGDIAHFLNVVWRREKIETTGIGHGIAIAHGKIMGLEKVHVALGISKEDIDYHALDGKPVHMLFVIASSPNLQGEYLKTLSRLLGIVHAPGYRSLLDHFEKVDFPSFLAMVEKDFSWLT